MKSEILIPLYTEQEVYPKTKDIIKGIVKEGFPDYDIRFLTASPVVDRKVLVLGKITKDGWPKDVEYVHTYSVAQILTKANAATVLCAGVRRFVQEPEKIPFLSPTFTASSQYTNQFNYDEPIAIDIETSGNLRKTHTPEEVELLSIAFYQPGHTPLVVVSHREDGTDTVTHTFEAHELKGLARELVKFNKPVYHNGKFDIRILERLLGVKLTNWFDTMLAHHVLNQAAGDHKLKHLAQLYLGAPEWEKDLSKYTKGGGHYELIPRNLLVQYNGYDVYWTYKLYELFAPQIEADEEAEKAFFLEMQAADFLLDVEKYGIPFDTEYAMVYGGTLLQEKDDYLLVLRAYAADNTFNPGSPIQVKKFLAKHGVTVTTTDEDMMHELLKQYPDNKLITSFVRELLNYRKASKMYSTYVKGWSDAEREGRVHPTFLVHGTSTGRLSSTGPNAQNFPRDKRVRRLVAVSGVRDQADERSDERRGSGDQ